MKKTHIILLLFLSVTIAVVVSMYADSSQYTTFETAVKHPGREYQVVGFINRDKPFEYDPMVDPNHFAFYVTDEKGMPMKVVHHEKPNADIDKTDKVVMFGSIKDGEFHTTNILTKCPSKYENEDISGEETASNQ